MSVSEIVFPPLFLEGAEHFDDFTTSPDRMVWVEERTGAGGAAEYHVLEARMDQGVSEDGSGARVIGVDFRKITYSLDLALNVYCALACRPADAPELQEVST